MVRLARILVPVNFSGPSDAAVEEALFLARRLEASIELLYVWRPSASAEEESAEMALSTFARSDVGHEMRRYLQQAEAAGVVARGRLAYGDPERLILEAAAEHDLIVMGTRGRGSVSHVLRPSLAEHVVRRAPIPVLTIHAPLGESGLPEGARAAAFAG
jgi:nucleotide-binding universal stress UspA family protein